MEPMRIPRVRNIEINMPTDSFKSSGALEGDFTAHRVEANPFVSENRIILTILNQSASYPNSHEGETSKAIKKKVTINMILE
jgi:hypothetical protein